MPQYRCTVEFDGSPWASRPVEIEDVAGALNLLKDALGRHQHTTGLSLIDTEDGSQHLMIYEPENNLVTLLHREHPSRSDYDVVYRCARSRNELLRFAEDSLGSWDDDCWHEHPDEATRRASRDKLWEKFQAEYRTRIRNWVIAIRQRDNQSVRALRRMAAGVRRAMPGVRTEIVGPNNGVTYRSALVPKILDAKDAEELAAVIVSDITGFCRIANEGRKKDEPSI